MKKLTFIVILIMAAMFLCSCFSTNTPTYTYEPSNTVEVNNTPAVFKSSSEESYSYNSNSKSSNESSSFTNEYGTSTTKCAHSGCTNYIASSGDTNCCTTHSKKCLECGKYIDEDALYCMSCISAAATKGSSSSSSYSSSSYSSSSISSSKNKCHYTDSSGKEICSDTCASGSNFCSYHTKYLTDIYNSFVGGGN